MATLQAPIETLLGHIRCLAEDIGPRGSTTEGEKRGAQYCQSVFASLQLEPCLESFRSAVSIFHPHLLSSLLFITAFLLYPLGGPVTAALISIATLASELLELGFKDNMFRHMVATGESQNVFAAVPPRGEHRQDLVLIGHIDTQRTPLVFSTPRWVKIYQAFTTVAFVLFSVQVVLYAVGIFTHWNWIWYATIPTAVAALLLAAMCYQADRTPFTAGANDNASAVSMVLTLAEKLAAHPLEHTRVYCVCTGCEEVQHYGAIDFFRRHRAELRAPRALVFELLGCAGPAWMTQEGIIVPFHPDPDLARLAEQLSAAHPEWGAYPVKISGGNSELADCVRYGVPALTLFGLKPDGEAPYWHQVGDTFDKMNPAVLGNTWALTWEMIQALDGQAADAKLETERTQP